MNPEYRILLCAASPLDAVMTREMLFRAAIDAFVCANLEEVVRELPQGAGAVMLTDQALIEPGIEGLTGLLAAQPQWSDLPLLVLARAGAQSAVLAEITRRFANVIVIQRPAQVVELVTVSRSALRARERQYQLRAMHEGFVEADRRMDGFLVMLGHELRNPLAPITTALALMESSEGGAGAPRHHRLIRRQVGHLTRLIDELLDVSRVTQGQFGMQFRTLVLSEVLADAIEACRAQVDARGHQLTVDPGLGLCVEGDRVRLTQVVASLLDNAAKYTPPGGHIRLAVRGQGDDALIDVIDDGIGMPAERLEAIFELFVQYNAASRGALNGLGIGLALARTLVERHGGSIRATSRGKNRGSTFSVRLPVSRADPRLATANTSATSAPAASASAAVSAGAVQADGSFVPGGSLARAPAGHGATSSPCAKVVMVVDDNRDAADSLAELLQLKGATVLLAYDAEHALDLSQNCAIDAAVLDIGLPGMDGCDLARALRDRDAGRAMTLIALTGWGQEAERLRIAAAGFDHHLVKPVEARRLLTLL